MADPPWPLTTFEHEGAKRASKAVRALLRDPDKSYPIKRLPYSTMTVDEIAELPVAEVAASQSHVFVWTFDKFVVDGSTTRVIQSWGFKVLPRIFVWRKANPFIGTAVRPAHELIMVGRKGSKGFNNTGGSVLTVQDWKQPYDHNGKVHSAKPDGMQDMVEMLCDGPYLELFARRARLGWDSWGNEALGHVELASGH